MDGRQVLRGDADDGRGPPRRGLQPLPAGQTGVAVADQPEPAQAPRPDHHRLALGLQIPGHADPGGRPGHGRLQQHVPDGHRAAGERVAPLRHERRVPPRRLRRHLAQGLLHRHARGGAPRPRGLRARGLRADARPPAGPRGVTLHGLQRRRGEGTRAGVAGDEDVSAGALRAHRPQHQTPRPADTPGSRGI